MSMIVGLRRSSYSFWYSIGSAGGPKVAQWHVYHAAGSRTGSATGSSVQFNSGVCFPRTFRNCCPKSWAARVQLVVACIETVWVTLENPVDVTEYEGRVPRLCATTARAFITS